MDAIAQIANTTADAALLSSGSGGGGGGGGGGGVVPTPAWSQPTWFIDPQNVTLTASDANTGLTAGTALRTYHELAKRYGTYSPILRQDTTITFLSDHTDNTDPVIWNPYMANQMTPILQGVLNATTQVATGILAGVVPKNHATQQLLNANIGPSGAQYLFLVNTSRNARCWVYKNVAGNVFALSQPVLPLLTPPPGGALTLVDTFTNGDSFTLYRPTAINIVQVAPVAADVDTVNFEQALYVKNCTVFDPSGVANDPVAINVWTSFQECITQRTPQEFIGSNPIDGNPAVSNCYTMSGFAGGQTLFRLTDSGGATSTLLGREFYAGILGDPVFTFWTNLSACALDFEIIVAPTAFNDPVIIGGSFGIVYLDTGVFFDLFGYVQIDSPFVPHPLIWGHGRINGVGSGRIIYDPTTTAVAQFTSTGGLSLNSLTVASSHTGASPDVLNSGIALTPANLDAAAGVAGFGGNAFILGGASISNGAP